MSELFFIRIYQFKNLLSLSVFQELAYTYVKFEILVSNLGRFKLILLHKWKLNSMNIIKLEKLFKGYVITNSPQILKINQISRVFNKHGDVTGKDWLIVFWNIHENLPFRKTEATNTARVTRKELEKRKMKVKRLNFMR